VELRIERIEREKILMLLNINLKIIVITLSHNIPFDLFNFEKDNYGMVCYAM
jgi:hypothetical protein